MKTLIRYNPAFLSKISFVLLLLIVIFGTSLPFQPTLQEVGKSNIDTSNIVNQIAYISLFFISLISAAPKISVIWEIISREKYLSIFLLWALISVSWSAYPFVSFKRWFEIFDYFFITIIFLVYHQSFEDLIKTIKPVIFIYLILSFIVVLTIPAATDPGFGTWRGFSPTKNLFGQINTILIILVTFFFINEKNQRKRFINLFFLIISIILVVGSDSSTAIFASLGFIFTSLILFILKKFFEEIGLYKWIAVISIVFIALVILSFLILDYSNFAGDLTGMFNKDPTFSKRTVLWSYIIEFSIMHHPFFGCGFQGFWVFNSIQTNNLYKIFVWLPIQAHNGYIDLVNEVGIVGFLLFLFYIIAFFVRGLNNKKTNLLLWIVIATLIINFTESTIFRPGYISGIFIMIIYLFMTTDRFKFELNEKV